MTQTTTREITKSRRPENDVIAFEDAVEIRIDMPGAHRESLELSVKDRELLITASGVEPPQGELLFAEFDQSAFEQRFTLSPDLDPDLAEAKYHNGVLIVRIPKRAEAQSRLIPVKSDA